MSRFERKEELCDHEHHGGSDDDDDDDDDDDGNGNGDDDDDDGNGDDDDQNNQTTAMKQGRYHLNERISGHWQISTGVNNHLDDNVAVPFDCRTAVQRPTRMFKQGP